MIWKLQYLKDVLGNNYLGINIPKETIDQYLDDLGDIIGEEKEIYIKNQQTRDRGKYHITVINVQEFNSLSNKYGFDRFVNGLESVFDYQIDDLRIMGIGKAEKGGNRSYFVVVNSESLDELRRRYDLPEHDFHITIGFKWKDVFGVRKNEVIKKSDPFLKVLSEKYFKNNESFNFLREIKNYKWDDDLEIDPIEIYKTFAIFRIGRQDYFSVGLIDDELRVQGMWQDSSNKPILSMTLVSKKLKE